MKKVICSLLALVLGLTSVFATVFAAEEDNAPVETLPAVYNDEATKGMIGNVVFGPKYTISEADGGVKVEGVADRGTYERVEVRGTWFLDGLRVEMSDVATKSSLLLCFVKEVGGFPTGGGGVAVGLDPVTNNLWITSEGGNTEVAKADTSVAMGWGNGTAPGAYKSASSPYSIQFNYTLRDTWVITVDDCAAYEVSGDTFKMFAEESDDGKETTYQAMLSFVSNPASDVTDKEVTFTVTRFVEKAAPINLTDNRTSFIPAAVQAQGEGDLMSDPTKNTSVDKGYIFNNVFGGSYELTNLENGGGVSVYAYDDRSEYERLNIGGLWNMDGFRMELKDVESPAPIMLGLLNNYGQYVTPAEKLSAFGIGYENDSLRITSAAENVYTEDTTQEIKDKELVKPVRKSADIGEYWKQKSDYSIQFNKLENGKWLVTVDDCIQYEFDETMLGEKVNMSNTALAFIVNPKDTEVKFTVASFKTGVAAPVVENKTDQKPTDEKPTDEKPTDTKPSPETGVAFPAMLVIVVLISGAILVVGKKRHVR